MCNDHPLKLCLLLRYRGSLLASLLLALAWVSPGFAQTPATPGTPAATTQSPSTKDLQDWRGGMAHTPPPQTGCFTSSYPNTEWQQVPCANVQPRPNPPARGPRPLSVSGVNTVGDGNDVTTTVASGHISLAVGSFESVTGVTSLTSQFGANDYSLQLNTNLFTTPVCTNNGGGANCKGWQQFIFSNGQCTNGGGNVACVFIQYWLIGFGSVNCPAGWTFFLNGSDDECYANSNIIVPPIQTLANLGNLSVIAEATSGGNDAVIFSSGTALYAVQTSDSFAGLGAGGAWTALEYNLVGDGDGSEATFNNGAAIVVRVSVDNGSPAAPSCPAPSFQGFTAETNSLTFATAPVAIRGTTPAIMWTENSSGGAASPCAASTAVASGAVVDSHDFNADGHGDIFWRDTSGNMAIWEMNGTTILNPSTAGPRRCADHVWSIVGQHDFNGDGKPDILWRDTSGNLAIWEMNGTTILNLNTAGLGNVPTVWSVAGIGDFNGDGYADILWRNTSTGDLAIWEMNGTTILNANTAGIGNVPTNWSVVGVGDFNGDGKADILWRNNNNGNVAIWLMNGITLTNASTATFGNMPASWSAAGTGDFNGDGKSDILWRDTIRQPGDLGDERHHDPQLQRHGRRQSVDRVVGCRDRRLQRQRQERHAVARHQRRHGDLVHERHPDLVRRRPRHDARRPGRSKASTRTDTVLRSWRAGRCRSRPP